jgi:hypothetical protein
MERLKVDTVLLVPSQAIDEKTSWSPDSRYLAVNVMGKWYKVDTSNLLLRPATWHELNIGTVSEHNEMDRIDESTANKWAKNTVSGVRRVKTRSGTTLSLFQKELSTAFGVQVKGKKLRTLWNSGMENCYELAVAPNDHLVAYICEMNGVVVTD